MNRINFLYCRAYYFFLTSESAGFLKPNYVCDYRLRVCFTKGQRLLNNLCASLLVLKTIILIDLKVINRSRSYFRRL